MTNEQLIDEMTNTLLHDSEHPEHVLEYLAKDCTWTLEPGGTEYHGLKEIETFISVAMAMRGKKQRTSGADVKLTSRFAHQNYFCLEYEHAFSFGNIGKNTSKALQCLYH